MLGLKHNTNVLVNYDPSWATEFASERQRLFDALDDTPEGIEHYGSTAVVGMRAKPILDILVGVLPLSKWVTCHNPLLDLGYDYAANAGVPGHYIFGRGRDMTERTHLVHVVKYMGRSWQSNLAFRDALRQSPELCAAYVAEKERALSAAPDSRAMYNELKHEFIELAKAKLATVKQGMGDQ
jgi:GrpB-like predicted nucleotidyltransferase (UPF0157 family)